MEIVLLSLFSTPLELKSGVFVSFTDPNEGHYRNPSGNKDPDVLVRTAIWIEMM